VVQKYVLYLGEVNDRQRASWERAVRVIDETSGECRTLFGCQTAGPDELAKRTRRDLPVVRYRKRGPAAIFHQNDGFFHTAL
jgi:hypothetical protein